ncbi:MAG: DNA alkylation repair protein [Anaerolineae bacterium]
MTSIELIAELRSHANPANVAGMAQFGINPHDTLGVSIPVVRELAKRAGRDHALAAALWESGIHEARVLAALVDDPRWVTEEQMERWVTAFDSWDVCDQVCSNLFDRTPFAWGKTVAWSSRPEEFVKRAGFVLIAALAVHDKRASDQQFEALLPIIAREADDARNFVKKAVNWALRGIGKRNRALNTLAIATAQTIGAMPDKTARWVAADALRELTSDAVQARLR